MKWLLVLGVAFGFSAMGGMSVEAKSVSIKNNSCKKLYREYADLSGYKAFAVSVDGLHCGYQYGTSKESAAKKKALANCHKYARGGKCVLYKVN